MLSPEDIDCQIKNPVPVWGYIHFDQGVPENPPKKNIAHGCSSKFDGEILLLKIKHTLILGHGEIRLVLARYLLVLASFAVSWEGEVINTLENCELY